MKRVAITAVAVVAFAGTLTAPASTSLATGQIIYKPAPPPQCTAKAFRPFSEAVWRLILWERGKPPVEVIQAQRRRLACAGPANRRAMQKRWARDHRRYVRHRRHELVSRDEIQATIDAVGEGTLAAIRACESGDDYSTNTGNGFYGAYQFDLQTWLSVGGSGLPSDASPREQDYRASLLYLSRGPSPWPICG